MMQQPKALWAVAFACVVAFMGIGLVDPIARSRSSSRSGRCATAGS